MLHRAWSDTMKVENAINLNPDLTLSAALLVGGESRRMGADKATLSIDGKPLWSRQLEMLRELRPQQLLISARAKPSWCPVDVDVVLDAPPSLGPLSGIVAMLENIRSTHLLVVAVDLPQMKTTHLQTLWSRAQPGRGIVPKNGDHFEPLCAIYPVETLISARRALTDGQAALQPLVRSLVDEERLEAYRLAEEERLFYRNMNRPADLLAVTRV